MFAELDRRYERLFGYLHDDVDLSGTAVATTHTEETDRQVAAGKAAREEQREADRARARAALVTHRRNQQRSVMDLLDSVPERK